MSSCRRALLFAVFAALALFVAACGSDDGGDETSQTSSVDGEEQTTTSTDEADTPTTEGDEEGESDQDASGLPTLADIEAIDDFCAIWSMGEGSSEFGDLAATSPEQVQQTAQVLNALLVQGVATAPAEIKDDFSAMASSVQDFYAILADYEYDFTAIGQASANDPELAARMEAIYSTELDTHTTNIEAWVAANC